MQMAGWCRTTDYDFCGIELWTLIITWVTTGASWLHNTNTIYIHFLLNIAHLALHFCLTSDLGPLQGRATFKLLWAWASEIVVK